MQFPSTHIRAAIGISTCHTSGPTTGGRHRPPGTPATGGGRRYGRFFLKNISLPHVNVLILDFLKYVRAAHGHLLVLINIPIYQNSILMTSILLSRATLIKNRRKYFLKNVDSIWRII